MTTKQDIESICDGTPGAFAESVLGAYSAIFEQEDTQQKQDDTVPVDTDSLASSDTADALPGLIKAAQQAQQQADTVQQQADKAKQDLRDALAIAGNDQETQNNGQQNAQA